MVTVTEKTRVRLKLDGRCASHSRTDVSVRNVGVVIDEPAERGGTNQGPSPTETLMAALIGCTNVIAHKVAAKNGIRLEAMDIRLEADFDRRGVTLAEEIRVPFPSVTLHIDVVADATEAQVETLKREVAMFCPLSKVLRESGSEVKDVWNVRRS